MTILDIAIHPQDENPVFGERATRVKMMDEGGGSFVVIEQDTEDYGKNSIRLDFEEAEKIFEAIKILEKGRVE